MTDIEEIKNQLFLLRQKMKDEWGRHVSIQDLLSDRWETAAFYGFGKGSSCYNNSLIIGDVIVGEDVWIGPNTVLDGQGGGLTIGNHVAISTGVQIYTHHAVKRFNSLGEEPMEFAPVKIGNGIFIGPNSIIQMGVTIGNGAIIGAMSFVNKDVPENGKWYGRSLYTE